MAEGTVYDENKSPLIGVTILIKGTQLGTTSDLDGKFKLKIPTDKATLKFSFIGYKIKELPISQSNSKNLKIQLEEDVTALDDLIITGYNIKKDRTKLVGSAQQISGEQLQTERPIESFDKMLSGQIAGLTVENVGGGELGVAPQIRVRGQGSLVSSGSFITASSSQPLFVIDGVPIYDTNSSGSASAVTAFENLFNPLAQINPDDIESITVLKDASATAIYGANASNGVILITTKRANSGKISVNVKYNTGVASAINQIELLNTQEYVMLYRETLLNSGFTEAEAIEQAGSTDIEVDWANIGLRSAQFQSANISMEGGGKNTSARFSLGYFNQEAISVGSELERLSTRINLDMQLDTTLKLSYSFGFNLNRRNALGFFDAVNAPPNLSPFNPDGSFSTSGRFGDLPNPLAVLAQNENNSQSASVNGNLTLTYAPLKTNLILTGLIGLDTYQNKSRTYNSQKNASGFNRGGYLNLTNRENFQWISNLRASWGKTIFGKLQTTFLAGGELTEQTTNIVRTTDADFPYDDLRVIGQGRNQGGNSSRVENATVSYFGNVNLEWDEKYIFNVNVRSDISSIFGGDVSKGVFASVGGAWLLHKENFLAGISKINLLKLRASFGRTGNSRIGSFAARGLYKIGNGNGYAGELGIGVDTPENPQLTWESNYKTDISAELGLWKNRLKFTATYYRNNITDAITNIDVPYENGFTSALVNAVDMRNQGIELILEIVPIYKPSFSWSVSLNLATNRNEITKIKIKDADVSSGSGRGLVLGQDVRTIYGIQYVGVDPQTGKQQFRTNEGTLSEFAGEVADLRIPLGSRNPDLFGGLNQNFSYKQFTFSVLSSFSFGSQISISPFYEQDGRQFFNNQSKNLLDRWQKPGDITEIPQLSLNASASTSVTYRDIYDNDYLKIENISISYRLARKVVEKLKLESVNVFTQVSNAGYFYFVKKRENRNGIQQYRYLFPEARTFSVGLKVGI